jgi:serine/threonine protein kinase
MVAPVTTLSKDLIQHIRNKNCIVFVGPAVSVLDKDHLSPPGPATLTLELATQLREQFDDYSLPWIAQYYADRYDIDTLHNYVADRLDNPQYRPTRVHYMLVQLPFNQIVYTGQDILLHKAFENCAVPVNHVLQSDAALSLPSDRLLIQPYGSVSRPESLRLTEDERRLAFEKRPDLVRFLQNQTFTQVSLLLGFTQGDPDFRELYQFLRPQVSDTKPRAYLVQEDFRNDDRKYWTERNAAVIQMETLTFLDQLGNALGVSFTTNEDFQEPPLISGEERLLQEKIILNFSRQIGLGSPVESGAQLQPIANGLATLRQALIEHGKADTAVLEEGQSNPELDARLILQQGNVEWAEGNLDRAKEAFEKAISQDPKLTDAYLSLLHLLIETGELDRATEIYKQILSNDPKRAFIPPRYELIKVLAQTDVGVNYLCTERELARQVVITVLHPALARQLENLKRFEAQLSSLSSERISHLFEIGTYNSRSYLVTEYFEGPSLRERLNELTNDARISVPEVFEIIGRLAEALMEGARQGVPHLDLSPENILLTERGAVLINYGFSRLSRARRPLGRVIDTRSLSDYEAPEQRAGEIGDERSDVYALGTIFHEMLTGRLPGLGEFTTVSEVHPQIGEALDLLIDHARAYDPSRRFHSAEEIQMEIRRILLSTDYRNINQYIRIALAGFSNLYANFFTRKGGLSVIGMILVLLVASVFNWRLLLGSSNILVYVINTVARFLSLVMINSLVASALGYYVVRELARERGLGSMIRSGRGIGAILGLLISTFFISSTKWGGSGGFPEMLGEDFVSFIVACTALSILATAVALGLIQLSGWLLEKRRRHYTAGFYIGYLILCFLILLVILLGPPPYVLRF